VRSEMRDHILAALDETAKALGAETFEQGVELVCRIVEKFMPLLAQLRTRERAIAVLDQMPDFPPEEEPLAVAAFRMLPQFLGIQVRKQLPGVLKELPGGKKGRRRALSGDQQAALCTFIRKLYLDGVEMRDCKKRASLHFNVATRTVQRIWANRASVSGKRMVPDSQDVMNWIMKILTDDNKA
jgi:hypothetical protein